MPAKKEVSLLPVSENISQLSGRVIRWLTTVGRYIIVFTELIVVVAFISRFWLDRKNADLSEIVRQQKAILESTKPFESDFTLLQQRLKFIQDLNLNSDLLDQKITSVVESTPEDIIFQNISIDNSDPKKINLNLTAFGYKEDSIVNFISNLSLNPTIKSIEIQSIEKKPKDDKFVINLMLLFNPSATNDRV